MQVIRDQLQIEAAKRQVHIEEIMDNTDQPFSIRVYEKGEFLTSPGHPSEYLMLCLSGSAKIYDLFQDSEVAPVGIFEDQVVVGDLEFCGRTENTYYMEAAAEIRCLALDIRICHEKLDSDVRFLHFILRSLADKMDLMTRLDITSQSLEDKVLHYMENFCPDHRLEGVGKATMKLHCSRRQLQRILQKLCEDGKLVKEKKGCYRLFF